MSFRIYDYVTESINNIQTSFLPLSGGTMSGVISQPLTPIDPSDVTNKAYVDSQVAAGIPDATTSIKGKIRLSGDLDGIGTSADTPIISNLAITNAKLANLSGTSQLKGSSSVSLAATDITLGTGLSMSGTTLNATGVSTPAGDTQFGLVQFDPVGDLTQTSLNSGIGAVKPLAITNAKLANLSGTSQLKGSSSVSLAATDITLGTGLSMSGTTLDTNISSLSNFFLPLSGGIMSGAISQSTAPVNPNDLTNKLYVDSQITSITVPDATTLVKGKIQLAGDLSGVANAPLIAPLVITNAKIANLSGTSQLKGSSSTTSAATDIILGSGLSMTLTTLSVDQSTFNKAGATQFGMIEFDPAGDLNATAANSGIGVVKPLAITNAKLANLSGMSQLKGSSSTNSAVTDISLGTGLSMSGTVLNATGVSVPTAGNTQFGIIEFNSSGDLTQTSLNSGIGVVKPLAITNPKVNPGAASTLKGTNSLVNVDDIALGSGLSLTAGAGPTLSVDPVTLPKAGATQFGVVEFDPAGDLNATAANSGIGVVKPLAITNPKVNPGAASTLKGTNSLVNVDDIALGSGLSLTAGAGPTLSVDPVTLPKAGATQFGVVEFDPAGDLNATAANSGIGVVKPLAITNTKLANLSGTSQLKGSSSATSAATDISLGTGLSINASTIFAAISFIGGTNPNITTPTDRPATSNLLYIGTDGSIWLWNGSVYISQFGASTAQTVSIGTAVTMDTISVKWITSPNSNVQLQCSSVGGLAMVFEFHNNASNSIPNNTGGTFFGLDDYSVFQKAGNSPNYTQNPTYPGTIVIITQDILTKLWYLIAMAGPTSATPTLYNVSMSRFSLTNVLNAGTNQFGVIRFNTATGDIADSGTNSGIGVVKPLAITNAKLADLSGTSQLKGSSSTSSAATDITLGTGLSMSGTTLNSSVGTLSLVQFTGGITYPTLTGIGATTITYTAFSAYARYTNAGVDVREIWTYPGSVYTPIWANGASQQATYIAFVPDYTTINTTKTLKIVEYALYRNFPTDQAAEIVFYTVATRDTGTTFFTTFVSFMQGYYGTEYGEKIQIFYKGSVSLNTLTYRLTPESSNVGAVVGTYFRLASGSAKVAGRNYLNDIFSTYVIVADPFIQGAAANMTVTVAGRGTVGNEGQQFFRVTGSTAKVLGSSTSIIFEPVNANSTADYSVVAATKWTYYKLVVLPGSRIIIVQPHNLGAFNSAATALATQHIYDTSPYNTYDRWIPTIFVGYMALNGSLNLNANWTANVGLYAFYDVNKVQIA